MRLDAPLEAYTSQGDGRLLQPSCDGMALGDGGAYFALVNLPMHKMPTFLPKSGQLQWIRGPRDSGPSFFRGVVVGNG